MERFQNIDQEPQADFTLQSIKQCSPLDDNQEWERPNILTNTPQKNTIIFNLAKLGLVVMLLILALCVIPSFISTTKLSDIFNSKASDDLFKSQQQNTIKENIAHDKAKPQKQSEEKTLGTETIKTVKSVESNNGINYQKIGIELPVSPPVTPEIKDQVKIEYKKPIDLLERKPLPHNVTKQQREFSRKLKDSLLQKNDSLDKQQFQKYEEKYQISKFTKQIPLCIVVPTFNNEAQDRYLRNIQSIYRQNYTNYRVFIIDDASTDKTKQLIQKYLSEKNIKDKFTFLKNSKQLTAMPNLRKAAMQLCKSYEIFMIVDGDDQLIGKQVFKLYNAIFQTKKSWFVYSNFISKKGIGYSRPFHDNIIKDNLYRQSALLTSHLRAFYTKLFQLVKQQDLISDQNNQYFHSANDIAICIPVLEMSHQRVTYIPQATYFYNLNTGINNHQLKRTQQMKNQYEVRQRKQKYKSLDKLFTDEQIKEGKLEFLNQGL